MSFILTDFQDWLLDNEFIADHCNEPALEFGVFINKDGGFAHEFNGIGFQYNKFEINALHEQVIQNAQYPSDGQGNIIVDEDSSDDKGCFEYHKRRM